MKVRRERNRNWQLEAGSLHFIKRLRGYTLPFIPRGIEKTTSCPGRIVQQISGLFQCLNDLQTFLSADPAAEDVSKEAEIHAANMSEKKAHTP